LSDVVFFIRLVIWRECGQGVIKNLRTSTKLLLLCGAFIVTIALATYGLVHEKLIAIQFASKELSATQYLQALQGIYKVILGTEAARPTPEAVDAAVDALAVAEANTQGAFHTAEFAQDLSAKIRALPSAIERGHRRTAMVDALAKARELISRVGDESNLTLDPDLDSYYVQNIIMKQLPSLLLQLGELQSLLQEAPHIDASGNADVRARGMLLDGMVRASIETIELDSTSAAHGNHDHRLDQTLDKAIGSMRAAVAGYLETARDAMNGGKIAPEAPQLFQAAVESVDTVASTSQSELEHLLRKRHAGLLGKLYSSLLLNGVVAGLSLLFAAMAYRQIVYPLSQLERVANKVRESKDYGLRVKLERSDEIGRLASAFNAMLEELAAARAREIADEARNATMQAEFARVARATTVGQMVASISHEINQPLAAVVNNANAGLRWLNREPPDYGEVEKALQRIVKNGERGSGIIESIRALLKKGERTKTRLDLNELIFDVTTLAQGQCQRYGVTLRTDFADDLPSLMGDRVQLQQVVLNLLMNAAEATASNSDYHRLVQVRSAPYDGGGAQIAVEDSGAGIKSEDATRIFDAFFTTKSEGMGMGLSICRSIVESHGGRITVANAVPHGAIFTVILPGELTSETP
jgi:signal transduction histidine kinase